MRLLHLAAAPQPGGGLVLASPSRPVQLGSGRWRLLVRAGEQPADLVAGQRDQWIIARAAASRLRGG
jgi:hypothetical protein